MDPRDPRRPGRAAQDHRRRGAGRARPRRRRAARRRSRWSVRATPSTATTPPTWRCSWARRSAPTPASWPDGSPRRWPGRRHRGGRRRGPRLRQPAHRGLRAGRRRQQRHRRRRRTTATPTRSPGSNVNLEFVSANPTGPIHIGGTRWAAVGDALGRAADHPGRRGGARVLLQRPRRPDRPVHQLADRRGQGRADAGGRLRGRLHRRHRRPGARQGARRAEPARRASSARPSARSAST